MEYSKMNDHVITLEHARDKLISRRRSLAAALLRNPEEVEQFIRIQNAVAAVEQALLHERSLALTATNTAVSSPALAAWPH
jgi:uncharacterized protein with PhoU and TrkA domain